MSEIVRRNLCILSSRFTKCKIDELEETVVYVYILLHILCVAIIIFRQTFKLERRSMHQKAFVDYSPLSLLTCDKLDAVCIWHFVTR